MAQAAANLVWSVRRGKMRNADWLTSLTSLRLVGPARQKERRRRKNLERKKREGKPDEKNAANFFGRV